MENKGNFIYEVGNLKGNDQDEGNLFHYYVLCNKIYFKIKYYIYLPKIKE